MINESQIECGFPLDTLPPCLVRLAVTNLCDDPSLSSATGIFQNTLSWTPVSCADPSDIVGYNIYYALNEGADYETVGTVAGTDNIFIHQPESGISGCYAVTALDVLNNESAFSNEVCLDNCPLYELPNTFTPNDDGSNDLYVPRINRFISTIDFKVYNKWGQSVFQTNSPAINWDGRNTGGKILAQGTYYYTAVITESRLTGDFVQEKTRTGYINLIR